MVERLCAWPRERHRRVNKAFRNQPAGNDVLHPCPDAHDVRTFAVVHGTLVRLKNPWIGPVHDTNLAARDGVAHLLHTCREMLQSIDRTAAHHIHAPTPPSTWWLFRVWNSLGYDASRGIGALKLPGESPGTCHQPGRRPRVAKQGWVGAWAEPRNCPQACRKPWAHGDSRTFPGNVRAPVLGIDQAPRRLLPGTPGLLMAILNVRHP